MAVVNLRNLGELQRALIKLGHEVEAKVPLALQSAARFGAAAVLRESAKTVPRPKASGTYERSWVVTRLKDGAVLSNSARHSIFVERGRRPGKPPPLDPIIEWVYQKRLASRARAARTLKSGEPSRAGMSERSRAKRIAIAVARKIAKRGTPGRFVLRSAMPKIAARTSYELRALVRKVTRSPPR